MAMNEIQQSLTRGIQVQKNHNNDNYTIIVTQLLNFNFWIF